MQRDDIFKAILSEFIRIETTERVKELDAHYTDGGRKSGDRQKKLAEAAVEAYANASLAVSQIGTWSANNA